MLRIKFDEKTYIISKDQYQYILDEERITEKGVNIGKIYNHSIGYYSKLEGLCLALANIGVTLDYDTFDRCVEELSNKVASLMIEVVE